MSTISSNSFVWRLEAKSWGLHLKRITDSCVGVIEECWVVVKTLEAQHCKTIILIKNKIKTLKIKGES